MIVFLMGVVANISGSAAIGFVVGSVLLITSFIPREKGALFDTLNPDLSAMATYVGKHRGNILTDFMNKLTIFQDINGMFEIKDRAQLTKLTIDNQPGPYTGVFSPIGNDITFSDQEISVDKWQRDYQIHPDRYRDSYLSYRRGRGEGANNMTIPFVEFTIGKVNDKLAADVNNITVWWGEGKSKFVVFDPAETYAVGDLFSFKVGEKVLYYEVIQSTNAGETPISHKNKFKSADAKAITVGLGTKIRNARTEGKLNVTSTGAITSTDAYDQFKEVWRSAPEWIRTEGGIMYCSFNSYEKLLDSFENNSKFTTTDMTLSHLPLTNKKCQLKPVSWMAGSEQLVCTHQDNLVAGTDLQSDFRDVRSKEQMYHVDFSITGVIGFAVQDLDALVTNDMV